MANNFNKKISDTSIRIGEVRFSYANLFTPRKNEDGTPGKYSVQLLIPKTDTVALKLINEAIEAAKNKGPKTGWPGGKIPAAARLHLPLRDGDAEYPDDANYEGMYFMNASSSVENKPGVGVLTPNGPITAMDGEDFYSGCWGVATVNLYAYTNSGNCGVAVAINNAIKTRDGDRLGGGKTMTEDFADLIGDAASYLD